MRTREIERAREVQSDRDKKGRVVHGVNES
jgi:hypothetical protein